MACPERVFRICSQEELAASRPVEHFRALVSEWVELCEAPASSAAVALWGRQEPVLRRFSGLGEVPVFVDGADAEAKDDVLAALIRLAQAGQVLAGRVVLQCLLPALRKMVAFRPTYLRDCEISGARSSGAPAEAEHFVVSECWLLVMNYPLDRRPRKIASNLLWDTKKNALSTPRNEPLLSVELSVIDEVVDVSDVETECLADPVFELFSRDLSACIEWAVRVGALSLDQGRLLGDVFLEEGMRRPVVEDESGRRNPIYLTIAQEQGVSYQTIVKQVSRARLRLIEAITKNVVAPRGGVVDADPILCAS